jgi:hypothetical protein
MEIMMCPKWKLNAQYKNGLDVPNKRGKESMVIDPEDGQSNDDRVARPMGHTGTKQQDLKCKASTLPLHETLTRLMTEKEETNYNRDEKRRMEKDATCASFVDLRGEPCHVGGLEYHGPGKSRFGLRRTK